MLYPEGLLIENTNTPTLEIDTNTLFKTWRSILILLQKYERTANTTHKSYKL